MSIHTTSGRWRLGMALAFLTAFLWGILPIPLKTLLAATDAFTITWFRFTMAGSAMAAYVLYKHGLPRAEKLKGSVPWLLAIAAIGLSGNYVLYLLGLKRLSPSTVVVVIQLAPIILMAGSLVIFKERFSRRQYAGLAVLVTGLALFFNDRLGELLSSLGEYTLGVLLIVGSGTIWAIYALAQKQLLEDLPSETIMTVIYCSAAVTLLPIAEPSEIPKLGNLELAFLAFAGLNTIVAYGCFSESLDHLETSRVSAVIATVPIITIAAMKVTAVLFPGFMEPERLNTMSIIGAFLVMSGSMITSLSRDKEGRD